MELNAVHDVKEEDESQAREEEQKLHKTIQAYKNTMLLIKMKMNRANELIRLHNDKMKECDLLSEELSVARTEKQDVLNKYNLTMEKVARLELTNMDYKQSIDKYKSMSDRRKIKLDENEKLINQYIFKIKDIEEQNSTLEDNVKTMQEEIKSAKAKANEKKPSVKHQANQTISIEKRDTSVNTDPTKPVPKKPVMKNKNIMTDESITIKTEPFPIYCVKCENHISPAPVHQILKIMSSHPPLLSEHLSPPSSPRLNKSSIEVQETIKNNLDTMQNGDADLVQPLVNDNECKSPVHITEQTKCSSFMEIDKLSRKINKLENLMKKNKSKTKQSSCCHESSCSSKNIKFVVKLPNEEKLFKYRKREKRQIKKIKRLNNRNTKIDRKQCSEKNKWQIENCSEPTKTKIIPQEKQRHSTKKRKFTSQEKEIDLFESPEISIPEIRNIDASPCPSEKSSSSNYSDSEIMETNLDVTEQSFVQDVNMGEFAVKPESATCSSTISQALVCKNIYENIVEKENVHEAHLIAGETSVKNSISNNDNLPISIENIEEKKQLFATSNDKTQEDTLSVQVVDNGIDINESVNIKQNNVSEQIKDENEDVSIKKSFDSIIQNIHTEKEKEQTEEHVENTENCKKIIVSNKNQILDYNSSLHISENQLEVNKNTSIKEKNIASKQTENVNVPSNIGNIVKSSEIMELNNDKIEKCIFPLQAPNIELDNDKSVIVEDIHLISKHNILHETSEKNTFENMLMLPEIVEKEKKYSETIDLNNDEIVECSSPDHELDVNRNVSVEETDIACEQTVNISVNDQEDLTLTKRSENDILTIPINVESPEKSNELISSNNYEISECSSPLLVSNENLEVSKIISIEERDVASKQTESINESCTLSAESNAVVLSPTRITRASMHKQNHNDTVEQENGLEESSTAADVRNFYALPVIMGIAGQNKNVTTPIIEKNEKINSSIKLSDVKHHIDENLHLEKRNITNKQIDDTNENSNSSSMSSDSKFFSPSGIKRGKCGKTSNIILSDDSSEEKSVELPIARKRKRANEAGPKSSAATSRKKLLTKIKNIRKNSKKPIIVAKSEPGTQQVKEEPSDYSNLPIETPSNSSTPIETPSNSSIPIETPSNSSIPIETPSTSSTPLEVIPNSSTSMEVTPNSSTLVGSIPTCIVPKKQRIAHTPRSIDASLDTESEKTPKVIRKTKSASKKLATRTDDKISSILEVYDKTCQERKQIFRNLNPLQRAVPSESVTLRNLLPDNSELNTTQNETNLSEDSTCAISPVSTPFLHPINNSVSIVNEKPKQYIDLDAPSPRIISEKSKLDDTLPSMTNSTDVSAVFNDTGEVDETKKRGRKKKIEKDTQDQKSPIRELRSRQVVIYEDTFKPKKLKTSNQPPPKLVDETNSCLCKTTITSSLNEYMSSTGNSKNYYRRRADFVTLRDNEKFVYEQLASLIDAEQWTNEINSQVLQGLLSSQDMRTIALFMIEYAADKFPKDEAFDKMHTPPAPPMTRSEQKLVTLILSIVKIHPEFSDIIIKGLQHKLFRLGSAKEVQIVERLFRILVVLNKIKKDREKVRIFCCDALYCLRFRASNIIYVALTCWPEIFPKHDSNNDIIVKTIVHIVMTLEVNEPYPKLNSLRKLLSTVYDYPSSGYIDNDFKVELLKNLQENAPGINTAVLLLCKKLGPNWSMENIIKGGLKHMIVAQAHPSLYEALSLLGNLLRSFPATDPNKSVGEIIDQLCDVLDGNAGSDDLQEGIVSCLLSISQFRYEQIARSVIKWQSNKDFRPATKDKLKSFFKKHDAKWWWKFVQTNFPLPQ